MDLEVSCMNENNDNERLNINDESNDESELQDELPELNANNIDELKMYLSISEKKNRNLARLVKEQSEEIKKLKEESDNQFEVIGRLASVKDELKIEIDQLNTELNEYKDEDLVDKLKHLNKKVDSLNIDKIKKEEEINLYKNDIKKLEHLNEDLSNKNDLLNEEYIKLEKELSELQLKNESINRDYNELKFKTDSVEVLNQNDAEGEKLAKDRIIIRQMNEISACNEKLNKKDSLINEIQLEVDKLKAELEKEKRINNAVNLNNVNSILLRIKNNSLDLKLHEISPLDQELKNKIVSDYEVEKLIGDLNKVINEENFEIGSKEDIKDDLNNKINDIITNFINEILQNEACAFDYIVWINDLIYEHDKECSELKEIINHKEKEIKALQDDINKIKIDAYRESQNVVSKSEYDDLRRENKELSDNLSFQKNETIILKSELSKDASSTLMMMDSLLESERESYIQNEKELKKEILILREEVNNLNELLRKLNGEYFINLIENEIKDIKNYTDKVRNGEIELNSQLINVYYNTAYDKYNKQSLIYQDEITRRNGMLEEAVKIIQKYLEKFGSNEKSDNEEFAESFNKYQNELERIRDLIIDIQNAINDSVVEIELDDKRSLDEKVASEYQEKIVRRYNAMIKTINDNAKSFSAKMNATSIDNAFKLYNNDINEMAKYYAKAINEARLAREVDSNEFSKLLQNAKIMMLCNEFYALSNYKENKYYEKINPKSLDDTSFSEGLNENFKNDIDNLKKIQTELNNRLNDIREDYSKKNNDLDNEIDNVLKEINHLNELLSNEGNESNLVFGDVTTSVNSIKVDLDAKKKVLSFLTKERKIELEKELKQKLDEIDNVIFSINKNERDIKDLYLDRNRNEVVFVKENLKIEEDLNRIYGIKSINDKLIAFNDIEYSLIDAMEKKDDELTGIIKEIELENFKMKKKIDTFSNLLYLKDEYGKALENFRIDYKIVGEYANIQDEIKLLTKRSKYYENEKRKAKVLIDYGIDKRNVKDSIMMFEAKIIVINKRINDLIDRCDELKRISIVNEYINVNEKLNKINELIENNKKRNERVDYEN